MSRPGISSVRGFPAKMQRFRLAVVGLGRLEACRHRSIQNPHHGSRGGVDPSLNVKTLPCTELRGLGVCVIARKIGRAAPTISRELRRKSATRRGGFEDRATTAQWHANRAAKRPKIAKLAENLSLRQYVEDRLSGQIVSSDGTGIAGPHIRWTK